jgi:uncharacterized protein (DUF488 family)
MVVKVVTIGVYGYTEEAFFQALEDAGVDTFCDIRMRRGLRGATYAFANSKRLQGRLADMGIRYFHLKELAPTKAIREVQYGADEAGKVAKRQRTTLSPAFVGAYKAGILEQFDPRSLLKELGPDAQVVALFCVERDPQACHRSLVAEKLEQKLGLEVEHIKP